MLKPPRQPGSIKRWQRAARRSQAGQTAEPLERTFRIVIGAPTQTEIDRIIAACKTKHLPVRHASRYKVQILIQAASDIDARTRLDQILWAPE